MQFYCDLMDEIKIRDNAMDTMLMAGREPAQIVYESCYLQLRMMCELIAVSCLVVHGDIEATKTRKMKETWQADQIIKRLSQIHAPFYPKPVQTEKDDKFKINDVKTGFLSKTDLISLYGKCGERLHRGTFKDVRHRISPQNVKYDQIMGWQTKIVNLLQHHWIRLHDSEDQIGVQMNAHGTRPAWHYWAKMESPPH